MHVKVAYTLNLMNNASEMTLVLRGMEVTNILMHSECLQARSSYWATVKLETYSS